MKIVTRRAREESEPLEAPIEEIPESPEAEFQYRWRIDVRTTSKEQRCFLFYDEKAWLDEVSRITTEIANNSSYVRIQNTIFIINTISIINFDRMSRMGPTDYWSIDNT